VTALEAFKKIKAGMVLTMDPGNTETGWILGTHDTSVVGHLRIHASGIAPNDKLLEALLLTQLCHRGRLVIECPRPRGQRTAAEEMETLIVIGRLLQAWTGEWSYAFRMTIKAHITGAANAKDGQVVQALKDRFGGEELAVGGKRCQKCAGTGLRGGKKNPRTCEFCDGARWRVPPGVLYGVKAHIWQALAVMCWWVDAKRADQRRIGGLQPTKTAPVAAN
jgi:hypothetical protein